MPRLAFTWCQKASLLTSQITTLSSVFVVCKQRRHKILLVKLQLCQLRKRIQNVELFDVGFKGRNKNEEKAVFL